MYNLSLYHPVSHRKLPLSPTSSPLPQGASLVTLSSPLPQGASLVILSSSPLQQEAPCPPVSLRQLPSSPSPLRARRRTASLVTLSSPLPSGLGDVPLPLSPCHPLSHQGSETYRFPCHPLLPSPLRALRRTASPAAVGSPRGRMMGPSSPCHPELSLVTLSSPLPSGLGDVPLPLRPLARLRGG